MRPGQTFILPLFVSAAVIGCTGQVPVAGPSRVPATASEEASTDDCDDPDLVLYSSEGWTGDKLCLSGRGDYDLGTLFRETCTASGECTKVSWENSIHSWTSKRAVGTFFARQDGVERTEAFSAQSGGDYFKDVAPDGTLEWDEVLSHMYKVTIRSVQ
jgi:hypothetical protein